MEKLKGYRTVIFNLVMAVIAVIQAFGGFGTNQVPTPDAVGGTIDAAMAGITAVWALGNVLLRALTDTPIFKKDPKQ